MFDPNDWLPKSVLTLRNYSRLEFFSDLVAGVTVGLVALPLAMAFAIASGMPPQTGLYCAVVAGFLISTLGGSKMQIGGPTGAFEEHVGRENICPNIAAALKRARAIFHEIGPHAPSAGHWGRRSSGSEPPAPPRE